MLWRAAWADVTNRYLERAGREERIDHRSNAARGLDEIPTIHEGAAAQALERRGIISDRCELNRQIKADNTLLRELKAEIKKLAALVARTVPAIAEGLEKLRSHVLIFCYQLSHIRSGKAHIQKSLAVWKPELERYTGLVQQIKEKSKERKALVAEKKALPVYRVMRHKALAVRITELTEDLEELCSEKALLLQKFEYAEDAGAEAFRKDIATMEAGLKKLEAQELKYSAELDKALDEYAELKAQAADFDPVELHGCTAGHPSCAGKGSRTAVRGRHAREAFPYYAAQRQAGNVSTARRGCGESAGAADDHAAKEYGAT